MGTSSAAQAGGAEQRARALARDLSPLGRVVRFDDEWVPCAQRGALLLQADCAVAAHHDHLETRFSHGAWLLDCLRAGLPVVCACGDELAERVAREDLGAAVASEHPAALASRSARARGAAGRNRSRCGAATRCTWPLALC